MIPAGARRGSYSNGKRIGVIKPIPRFGGITATVSASTATGFERVAGSILFHRQREARVLASLNHPNIALVYGGEEINGRHCIVMELVPEKRWR